MRRPAAALLLGSASFALVAALYGAGLFERLEAITLDARYATGLGRRPAGDDIVIAWIDQDSMDYMDAAGASFPWPRSVYQAVLEYVRDGGARAVVYDVLFDQQGPAEDDRAFGAALGGGPGDVLAMKFMTSRTGGRTPEATARFAERSIRVTGAVDFRSRERGLALPIPELEVGADLLGFVNVKADVDKIFRRYELLRAWAPESRPEPLPYPSLGLAAVLAFRGAPGVTRDADDRIRIDGLPDSAIATDADARILLNFRGPEFTFEHVKFVNIFESINRLDAGEPPLYPKERFRDKLVFVGINAEGYEDIVPIPLSRSFPGVELHATAADNLLRGDALRAPAWELPMTACAVAVATIVGFAVPGVGAALLALALCGLLFLVGVAWCWLDLLALPVAMPAVGATCSAGATFLWRLIVEGRQKREMRRAFSSYMAPEVLATVLESPESLVLGGETREVTLFFTDLKGFTGLAEHVGPTELVGFLNDYFTRMCEPILAEHGVIDKFIGDAIMAMFGAPLAAPDHAARAVRAALVARAVSARIAAELVAVGKPMIETRIGIHSGPAIVGNMGSARRFDYTAIGDTVNLASRLEGANKAFGTTCLVSESARSAVGDAILFREVGAVGVKGRDAPIRVFEPVVLSGSATSAELERVSGHEAALAALRRGDRRDAVDRFGRLAADAPDDGVVRHYLECLRDTAWDGVFRLDAK